MMTLTRGWDCMVVVCLVSLLQLVSSGAPVRCSARCTQPHQPCKVITHQACPIELESSNRSPASPSDLQVQTHMTKYSPYNMSVTFNVSWGVPGDSSIEYLTGFQLLIRDVCGKWRQCLQFDLSPTRRDKDQLEAVRLHLDCSTTMEQKSRNFSVQVTSLPRPAAGVLYPEATCLFAFPVLPGYDGSSSLWIPESIQVYNDSCYSGVRVAFTQAPSHFHFTQYDVLLVLNDSVKKRKYVTARGDNSTIMIIFTDLEPGEYNVMVMPYDNYSGIRSKCLCNTGTPNDCYTCLQLRSPRFTIHKNSTACHVMSSSSSASSTVIGVIIGITVGLVLCIVVVVAGVYHLNQRTERLKGTLLVEEEPSPGLETNNNETLSGGPVPTRKRLLLLDVGGYKQHRYVVDCLAKYLITKGHCDVQSAHSCVPDIRGDQAAWLSAEMNKSDKIVLVHSEGAHSEIQANLDAAKTGHRPDGSISPTARLFLVGFHLLAKCRRSGDEPGWLTKLVVVRFPYTDPQRHPLPVLDTEHLYTLTDEMGLFLSAVHNTNVRPKCETDAQLETAIETMVDHVRKHPDWLSVCSEQPMLNVPGAIQMAQLQRNAPVDVYRINPDSVYCGVDNIARLEPTENEISSFEWIPPDCYSQNHSLTSEEINIDVHRFNSWQSFGNDHRLSTLSIPDTGPDSQTVPKVQDLSTESLDIRERDDISV